MWSDVWQVVAKQGLRRSTLTTTAVIVMDMVYQNLKRVNSNCVNIMNTRNLSSQLDYTDTFNSGNIVKSPSHVIEMPTKNSIMSNLNPESEIILQLRADLNPHFVIVIRLMAYYY